MRSLRIQIILQFEDANQCHSSNSKQALTLVEEETRRYRPTKNYLEHLPNLNLAAFETPLLRTELDRVRFTCQATVTYEKTK